MVEDRLEMGRVKIGWEMSYMKCSVALVYVGLVSWLHVLLSVVMSHLNSLEPRSSIKAGGHRGKIGMSFVVRKAGDPPDRGVISEILCSGFQ